MDGVKHHRGVTLIFECLIKFLETLVFFDDWSKGLTLDVIHKGFASLLEPDTWGVFVGVLVFADIGKDKDLFAVNVVIEADVLALIPDLLVTLNELVLGDFGVCWRCLGDNGARHIER